MKKFGKKSLEIKDFEVAKIEGCEVKGCATPVCGKTNHCFGSEYGKAWGEGDHTDPGGHVCG